MNKNYTLHGYAALRIARRDGVTLRLKHGDAVPLEHATCYRVDLLHADVVPDGWVNDISGHPRACNADEIQGYNVSDYFHESRYLGPDPYGVEPRWNDA